MPDSLAIAAIAVFAAIAVAAFTARRELSTPLHHGAPLATLLASACAGALYALGVSLENAAFAGGIAIICALIAETDRRHFLIPDPLVLALLGLAALAPFAPAWPVQLIGAAIGGGLLLAVRQGYHAVRGADGLGLGDVKLAAAIGALLGPHSALIVIGVAALATAALLLRQTQTHSALSLRTAPFGVGLAAATAVATLLRAGGWA